MDTCCIILCPILIDDTISQSLEQQYPSTHNSCLSKKKKSLCTINIENYVKVKGFLKKFKEEKKLQIYCRSVQS